MCTHHISILVDAQGVGVLSLLELSVVLLNQF